MEKHCASTQLIRKEDTTAAVAECFFWPIAAERMPAQEEIIPVKKLMHGTVRIRLAMEPASSNFPIFAMIHPRNIVTVLQRKTDNVVNAQITAHFAFKILFLLIG